MPNNILLKYGTSAALTCDVSSLASDTDLLQGIESATVDNTTDGYDDYLISGSVTVASSGLTTARLIEVFAVAWDGSSWPDVFDGTTGAETITSEEIRNSICKPIAIMSTTATASRVYHFSGVSARQAFGGVLPSKFVLFVTQSTGAALAASGHSFRIQGVYYQVQ
jgi:hypothetical protein